MPTTEASGCGQEIGRIAAGGAGADQAQIVGFEVRERLPGLGIVQDVDHLEQAVLAVAGIDLGDEIFAAGSRHLVQHGTGVENQPAARMVARAPRAHFLKCVAHHVDAGRHRQQLLYFFFIEIDHWKNFLIVGTACMFPGFREILHPFAALILTMPRMPRAVFPASPITSPSAASTARPSSLPIATIRSIFNWCNALRPSSASRWWATA